MRSLVLVCEPSHAGALQDIVASVAHPQVAPYLVHVMAVDLALELDAQAQKLAIIQMMSAAPQGFLTTQPPLLLATAEVAKELSLGSMARQLAFDFQQRSSKVLSRPSRPSQPEFLERTLNQCGLALRPAAAALLGHWSHARLDLNRVERWINQFGRLGKLYWLAEHILKNLRMVNAEEMGRLLIDLNLHVDAEMCVSGDPRGVGKSGDFISTLLKKRANKVVHSSPAAAIQNGGCASVVLYEDGLWSATEAVGVIESLLGRRDPSKQKTVPLQDPDDLRNHRLKLAYGIATDYGLALTERFIAAEGLNVSVHAAQTINIAERSLIDEIKKGVHDLPTLWNNGPPVGSIRPFVFQDPEGVFEVPGRRLLAESFLQSVGQQLFENYLDAMRTAHGWGTWAESKRRKASLGMHGLGLLHAFEHSVPRASLPLLWGAGPVLWEGRKLDWMPLYENAAES